MRNFFLSFVYALNGIVHGFLLERNIRFHVFAAVVVIIVSFITGISKMEWLIVIILIAGMLALEMMNSAVERVVDLVTTERHPLAKQAKDLAAGAVLLFAIATAIIGGFIFLPKWFY